MNLRIGAAGLTMLAALILATTPTRAPAQSAEAAPASPTKQPVHARAAKPRHRMAKADAEPAKAHRGKRARLALARHRRRPAPEPIEIETVEESAAPAPAETPVPAHRETSAAKRFREFLSPQSFALAAGEELRGPRLLAAHFSGEMTDPEIIAAAWTGAVEPVAHEETAPVIAHDQTTGDDSPSTAPGLTHSDPIAVVRAAHPDREQPRMTFVRWFFVAWGGVLTFASAVRMAVG